MSIRLLLLDDNTLFRKGLSALLSQQPDISVAGDVSTGREAEQMSARLEPDVLLMDLRLEGVSGLDIATQIKRRHTQIKVVMLTASRTEEYVRAALRMGIDGYVLKDASLEELLIAIRSVAKGKKYLSPDVSGHVVESFLHPEQTNGKSSQLDVLTHRERGILQLIAEGRTNRSAAEFLCVSPKTVEKHRASLMQKLGLRNATEMTLAAIEMGLIERPSSFSRFASMNTPLDLP
ncbi:response regulator transcription factor [Rhodoferax sp.]|uniref:response regulator transcription factor n=1 Tax=Rhodoferax sp. TaxID=50421 RepID=UPI002851C7A1|nr:response regulator transcription factor [Rhodoferax sp.]MDR3370146.1 response regulator transcription factor [Rhodoferax sp.]